MPVVLLIILVIVSAVQPGAREGIDFYIGKFDGYELAKLEVWATALGQILFSLSPGFGTAITYSSFVSNNEDVYKAGMIVCVANSAFSILGGFAVFTIVGYLAEQEGSSLEEVASSPLPQTRKIVPTKVAIITQKTICTKKDFCF